jgi:hypothetical protein
VLSAPTASWLLVLGFALCLVRDLRLAGRVGLPALYLPLSWRLTLAVCLCPLIDGRRERPAMAERLAHRPRSGT